MSSSVPSTICRRAHSIPHMATYTAVPPDEKASAYVYARPPKAPPSPPSSGENKRNRSDNPGHRHNAFIRDALISIYRQLLSSLSLHPGHFTPNYASRVTIATPPSRAECVIFRQQKLQPFFAILFCTRQERSRSLVTQQPRSNFRTGSWSTREPLSNVNAFR